jgi:hypothetical protein
MAARPDLALEHLALRLRPLNRALRSAVEREARRAAALARPDVAPFCVTQEQARSLLDRADRLLEPAIADAAVAPTVEELAQEERLRNRAREAGFALPLDRLAANLRLSAFEQQAVLLCAAPELDRAYERLYAYVLDDLNRRTPCVEIVCALGAASVGEMMARRRALGASGALRRAGVLRASGEAPTDSRQELRLGAGVLDYLCGHADRLGDSFVDLADVEPAIAAELDDAAVRRAAQGVRDGYVGVVGIWGARASARADTVRVVANAAGRPLRRFTPVEGPEAGTRLAEALRAAAALDALLWIAVDTGNSSERVASLDAYAPLLAASPVPLLLTGAKAWRPVELLSARPYVEVHLQVPAYPARLRSWVEALPEGEAEHLEDLAARYRIGGDEIRAVVRTARVSARLAGNGHAAELREHLEQACAVVTRPSAQRFATLVEARRGPADLVLPPALHAQVLEVAAFFRAWPKVADDWGYAGLDTGAGGIKALFTGDSGTGKTLAAECIASELHMPLLKVDLSQVVSKWVGDTEKHLDACLSEAADGHAVLFFDEADAIFGKRGEVRHGVDRYANMEVSYLLQRLDDHPGLVVLSSNLKDSIDGAFTRRFHVALHFPRPEPRERRKLWQIAFPGSAPLESGLDLDLLARLDMTGAGIVGAARTAALLAASEGSPRITMRNVAHGIARQYRRESRVLVPAELGAYAGLLQEAR